MDMLGLQSGKNWSDGIMVMVMGGLLVRLVFIWKGRNRCKDIGVDNDGDDADC